MYYSNVGRYF